MAQAPLQQSSSVNVDNDLAARIDVTAIHAVAVKWQGDVALLIDANQSALAAKPLCFVERALRGDFAFIKAWKGDRWGNLIYRKTSRNFNPMMATAADYVIAEVEQLVELGQLPPDQIHTPGIFVNVIFQGSHYDKKIERRTVRKA